MCLPTVGYWEWACLYLQIARFADDRAISEIC